MLCRQGFPCPASAYKEEVLGIFNSFGADVLAELVLLLDTGKLILYFVSGNQFLHFVYSLKIKS